MTGLAVSRQHGHQKSRESGGRIGIGTGFDEAELFEIGHAVDRPKNKRDDLFRIAVAKFAGLLRDTHEIKDRCKSLTRFATDWSVAAAFLQQETIANGKEPCELVIFTNHLIQHSQR